MIIHTTTAVVLLTMGFAVGVTHAQTIPETVAANPGKPITLTDVKDVRIMPLSILVRHAELVVVAQLVRPRSYLSSTGADMYTDYDLVLRKVVINRVATSGPKPGQLPPLTVRLNGGELIVDKTPVRVLDLSREKWTEGSDLLLFLVRSNDKPYNFHVLGEAAGIFEIDTTGRVKSLRSGEKDQEMEGAALANVLQNIARKQ